MLDISHVAKISDPEERAKALGVLIDETQATALELSRLRREALIELLNGGKTQAQLAELLGISRSRVSMMLSSGSRPERAFFGTGNLTIAIGVKPEVGRSDPSNMLSAEALGAYEALAAAAKAAGLDADRELIPPPGMVDLNRPNLIVLTSPRLLPFIGQVMGADTHLSFTNDENGWYIVDRTTGTEYRSPRDRGEAADYAYIGRLPRPDGKGTFLYIAGIHAQGTLSAAEYVADNLKELHKELKTRRFSTVLRCRFEPEGDRKITNCERVTPLYRHEGV
ncbi:helix-turn-helix domain-containing protein [Antribacter gilvus]|uniref:helix-turn-helix domain-containing protein n=1 Tax=Antribacter gilvus TaxID=2304675 RepID=UPI000F7B0BE8|nr:sigma-70 family RNA polymerase sigma factor [Antribacter gilvus]